jgi:hypothetical protein
MWKKVDLCGAVTIDRVCDIFEVEHPAVPSRRFKIKVLERASGDYLAVPNVLTKLPDGTPDYISGLGRSRTEALQDLLERFVPLLSRVTPDDPEMFDWADPRDF